MAPVETTIPFEPVPTWVAWATIGVETTWSWYASPVLRTVAVNVTATVGSGEVSDTWMSEDWETRSGKAAEGSGQNAAKLTIIAPKNRLISNKYTRSEVFDKGDSFP